jgi:hypothetical protein
METIKRKLNSIGKECFIRDWNLWGLDTLEAVDMLMKRYGYKETGARTRVNCAKWLLQDKATREAALGVVIRARRVPHSVIKKAEELLGAK